MARQRKEQKGIKWRTKWRHVKKWDCSHSVKWLLNAKVPLIANCMSLHIWTNKTTTCEESTSYKQLPISYLNYTLPPTCSILFYVFIYLISAPIHPIWILPFQCWTAAYKPWNYFEKRLFFTWKHFFVNPLFFPYILLFLFPILNYEYSIIELKSNSIK